MAASKKQKGLLVLSKDKLDCFIPGTPAIPSLPFPPNIIRSMEVVDKNALTTYLKSFVQTHKIPQAIFCLIIHESLLFEKVLLPTHTAEQAKKPGEAVPPSQQAAAAPQSASTQPQPAVPAKVETSATLTPEEEAQQVQQFADAVPFEEVIIKTIKLPQGKVVILTNKLLITHIKEIFEQEGFVIETVLPFTVFGATTNLNAALSPQESSSLLAKSDSLRQYNMLVEDKPFVPQTGPVAMGMPQKPGEKRRLYLMLGVFGILIVLMVIMIMQMNGGSAETTTKTPQRRMPSASPTLQPTETPVASSAAMLPSDIQIIIVSNARNQASSSSLLQTIKEAGFVNSTVTRETALTAQSVVVFSRDIPEDLRLIILESTTSSINTPLVREDTTLEKTVRITL